MKKKIAVLVSGNGSNLQALIDAWRAGQFSHGELALVISNKQQAKAIERAKQAKLPTLFIDPKEQPDREHYDKALLKALNTASIDIVCLAGYMRLLTPIIVKSFEQRILNIHPSLLPSFGGKGMYGHHVHEAVINSGVKYSGCTVHLVDEGTDTGPIILQSVVPVLDHDTAGDLADRVLIEEHRIYPRAVELICDERLLIQGQRVIIEEKA